MTTRADIKQAKLVFFVQFSNQYTVDDIQSLLAAQTIPEDHALSLAFMRLGSGENNSDIYAVYSPIKDNKITEQVKLAYIPTCLQYFWTPEGEPLHRVPGEVSMRVVQQALDGIAPTPIEDKVIFSNMLNSPTEKVRTPWFPTVKQAVEIGENERHIILRSQAVMLQANLAFDVDLLSGSDLRRIKQAVCKALSTNSSSEAEDHLREAMSLMRHLK